MYYVVFFIKPKKWVVIPVRWVYNFDEHWEKFMYRGINSTQKHLCFYSKEIGAFDTSGKPNIDFQPDFEAAQNIEFPAKGCYVGFLYRFKMKYTDAFAFKEHRRKLGPPVYNTKRLFEVPIPSINPIDNNYDESIGNINVFVATIDVNNSNDGPFGNNAIITEIDDNSSNTESIDNINVIDTINPINDQKDEAIINTRSIIVNSNSEKLTEVDKEQVREKQTIKEEPIPIFELCDEDNDHFLQMLQSEQLVEHIVIDEDLSIIIGEKGVPKPLRSTTEGLIKRENDAISGDIPFSDTKGGGRMYKVGNNMIELPKHAIDAFLKWQTTPLIESVEHDKRFIHALLFVCLGQDRLAACDIDEETMNFVRDLLKIRVNGQVFRLDALQKIKDEICAKLNSGKKK